MATSPPTTTTPTPTREDGGGDNAASAEVCRQCGQGLEAASNFCPGCGTSTTGDASPDPLVGRVVADRYRIVQLIGRGGMGVVYKCEHTRMGKLMAIKLLHGDLARDVEIQRRFRREAQAASRLSHPNTVSIFDFGTSDGLMYLVMEFVPGDDLGKLLRGAGHIPPTRAAALAAQACGSLAEAHDKGIVHRDLKPENLLVARFRDGRDVVKLLDFGLAKLREGEDRNEVTSSGALVGTPYYMAPEIIRAHAVDHRADIYALGAVIYRAVTGVAPFGGSSPVAVLTKHLTDELVLPSRRRDDLAIPPVVDAIVARCMAKAPEGRYQRIDEVREALVEYLDAEGVTDSLLRTSGVTRGNVALRRAPTASGKQAVATRDDVERFERRLRRGRVVAWSFVGAVAAAAAGTGVFLWRDAAVARARVRDAELEPNNAPTTATRIAPGVRVRGQIGQRLAAGRGDVDVYRLDALPATGGPWRIRVMLSGQPNVDLALELLRSGQDTAIAVADDGGASVREVIAGFRLGDAANYYLSVHERVRFGMQPIESISDWYTLRYELLPVRPDEESEPNDREEIAEAFEPGREHRGYIESVDDVDQWCFDALPSPRRVSLTPPDGLDLELVVHPRDGAPETVVDAGRLGAAETTTVTAAPGARPPCVLVRASGSERLEHGDPEHQYTLRAEAP
jgi:hypothetical protein